MGAKIASFESMIAFISSYVGFSVTA